MSSAAEPRRGEVWYVDLDPTRGAEIAKTRPCVVLSADTVGRLPLRLVVPLTGWQEHFKASTWMVKVAAVPGTGLARDSAADTFQIRSVDVSRFSLRGAAGRLTDAQMAEIADAVVLTIGWTPDV